MDIYTRPGLHDLTPAVHGAVHHQELSRLKVNPANVTDFSSNLNPYGPSPFVLDAIQAAVLDPTTARATVAPYPDRDYLALRQAIAAVEQVPLEAILPTNGASELIQLIALAFVGPDSRQVIIGPTFGEYARAIRLAGGTVIEYRPADPALRFDIEAIAALLTKTRPDGVWLCTPNNPTGQSLTPTELTKLQDHAPPERCLWVIDESYRHFDRDGLQLTDLSRRPNHLIVRSLTKDQGLAGLRLGYALADSTLIRLLRAAQPPWSVNALAQIAGVAALQPAALTWRDETLARLHDNAAALRADLHGLALPVLPSSTPYALVEVGDATRFRLDLLRQQLMVRDATSFGLPGHVRIAAQRPEQNARLVAAIAQLR